MADSYGPDKNKDVVRISIYIYKFLRYKESRYTTHISGAPIYKISRAMLTSNETYRRNRPNQDHVIPSAEAIGLERIEEFYNSTKVDILRMNSNNPDIESWLDEILYDVSACWATDDGHAVVLTKNLETIIKAMEHVKPGI